MSKVAYRVQFDIPENKLSTIMALIAGEVTNMVVRDTAVLKSPLPAVPTRPARGPIAKRGSITAAAIDFVANRGIGKTFNNSDLAKCLRIAGGSASSATPLVSYLARDGHLDRVAEGRYRIKSLPPAGWKAYPADLRA